MKHRITQTITHTCRWLGLIAIGLSPSLARTETNTPPVQLREILVQDTRETMSLTQPGLEEAEQALDRIPGGAGVVDAEQYKQGRAATLEDALFFAPGVHAKSRFGSDETRLSIRGSGIQRTFHLRGIKLLQDGIPINTTDGSGDFQSIDPLALRYIEVYRGANALQYGSTTLGGAINLVMPSGHDADRFQIRGEGGSFDFVRGQISSGDVLDAMDYYLSLSHASTSGYRAHADQSNQRAFANLGWRLADTVETRFYVNTAFSDSELPGNLTKDQLKTDPRQANAFNVAFDHERDIQYYRLGNKTVFDNGHDRLTLGLYLAYQDLDHPIFQVIDQVARDVGLYVGYQTEGEFLGRRNLIMLGGNTGWGWTDAKRFLNVAGAPGALTADGRQKPSQYELYVENQWYATERLALISGAQLVCAQRKFDDRFLADGDQSDHQDYTGINPKIGARYELNEQAQLFANISRSFEPPTFGELANLGGSGLLSLDEQTAWTVEVGTRGRINRLAWDIAFYHAWVRDELLAFNVGPGGSSLTVNANKTLHYGIETGLELTVVDGVFESRQDQPKDRLVLRQAYHWGEFRFDNDPVYADNRLPGLPPRLYRAELRYEHPCGFYVGPNLEWSVIKTPVDMANRLFAAPYAVLGVRAGYRSPKGVSVFFEAKNLTDKTYAAATGVITQLTPFNAAQFLPGDGRSFYGGMELRW